MRKTVKLEKKKRLSVIGYLMPLGLLLVSFYVLPIIMSLLLSFTKYHIMKLPEFNGINNYTKLLYDETLMRAIKNTMVFTLGVVPIQTIGALLLATWLTAWKKNPIARTVQKAMFIPVISSMVLISIVWRILLNGGGSPLNVIVNFLGFSPDWLGDTKIALFTLMGISIWKNIGYFMVLYIAGLVEIPREYYEAAKVDGANKFQQFIHITIPQLRRTTVMVVFLGVIWSLQVFDIVYNLTGGGPGNATMTMTVHIYNLNFKNFNTGYAMAVANVLFFMNALLVIVQRKLLRRNR